MNIVVLAGGTSTERDVSLVSGMGIYKALERKGHNCMLLDVFLGYDGDDWRLLPEREYMNSLGQSEDMGMGGLS